MVPQAHRPYVKVVAASAPVQLAPPASTPNVGSPANVQFGPPSALPSAFASAPASVLPSAFASVPASALPSAFTSAAASALPSAFASDPASALPSTFASAAASPVLSANHGPWWMSSSLRVGSLRHPLDANKATPKAPANSTSRIASATHDERPIPRFRIARLLPEGPHAG